jgi:hypothetical protein
MQLDDPPQNCLPMGGGPLSPSTGNRFTPFPLSQTAVSFMKQSLEHNQIRRSRYRAHHLHVYSDGNAHVQLSLERGVSTLFQVPLTVSYLEVFGDDSEGALLLGVFLLPEAAAIEGDQPHHLSVTLEGGQTVAMEIALGGGPSREVSEYVIRIVYADAAGLEI